MFRDLREVQAARAAHSLAQGLLVLSKGKLAGMEERCRCGEEEGEKEASGR
jgi:hypothetical protein